MEVAAVTTAGTLLAAVVAFIGAVGDEEVGNRGLVGAVVRAALAYALAATVIHRVSLSVRTLRASLARLAAASFAGSTAFVFLEFAPPQVAYIVEYWKDLEASFIVADMVSTAIVRPIAFGAVVFAIALAGVMMVNGVQPLGSEVRPKPSGDN